MPAEIISAFAYLKKAAALTNANLGVLDQEKATRIMLHVHTRGKGVCGVFTREIAETKVAQVNQYSQEHKHPLLCEMEED